VDRPTLAVIGVDIVDIPSTVVTHQGSILIPESGTAVLLALGLTGLLVRRRS
jgi:hypothetical protein